MRRTLESNPDTVDEVEEAVLRYVAEAGFGDTEQYFITLAAREVLINAMKHGNCYDASKQVSLRVAMDGEVLTIEVTDEGEGFQVADIPDPHLTENRNRPSGRGVMIARTVMDEFSVEKGPAGRSLVRMAKRLRRE
ncbi:MAG: ATP-binding protein [Acidobacteria bacterium]|nr:ATP-binding protein [Acidobacteriota bacterium]